MARFYNTADPSFLDWNPQAGTRSTAASTTSDYGLQDIIGDINALPQDRMRLQELLQGYDSQINEFATALQQDPRAAAQLAPQIRQFRGSLERDMTAGELRAIQDRYEQATLADKQLSEALKDDPAQLAVARQRLYENVPELGYQNTGMYNRVNAPSYVAPTTEAFRINWGKNIANQIEEQFREEIQDKESLDRYTTLYQLGDIYEVTRDQVIQSMAGQVTDQMIQAENQRRQLLGLPEVDEASFYDPATGKLNLNTTYGRIIDGYAEAIARQRKDGKFITDQDEGALQRMRTNEELRAARGKQDIQDRDANWYAERMSALFRGEGFDQQSANGQWSLGSSNFLQGTETVDGRVVQSIEREAGSGRPVVRLVTPAKPATSANPFGTPEEASIVPLSLDFLNQVKGFNSRYVPVIARFLEGQPEYNAQTRNTQVTPEAAQEAETITRQRTRSAMGLPLTIPVNPSLRTNDAYNSAREEYNRLASQLENYTDTGTFTDDEGAVREPTAQEQATLNRMQQLRRTMEEMQPSAQAYEERSTTARQQPRRRTIVDIIGN